MLDGEVYSADMDSYLIFLCEWWRLFTDVVIKNGSFHALGNYSHLLAADAIDNG